MWSSRLIMRHNGKPMAVTGREGPLGCETSRLPHFLDNQPTDGGADVSLTRQPAALYLQEDSWYSFLLEAEWTPGHSGAGRIRSNEKSKDLIGNRTRDLPACSIVPQPTTLLRAPLCDMYVQQINRSTHQLCNLCGDSVNLFVLNYE
jgi:hypothetical protein